MTEEEKKAIEYFKEERKYLYKYSTEHDKNTDIILNLINKQQKENVKKDNIIKEAIEIISHSNTDFSDICKKRIVDYDKCEYKRNTCIRQYLENKVEGE